MSDAIEFSLGGSNKNFVAVLNDTERKAKESATRTNKELDKVGAGGLKSKGKIAADLNGLAGDFARVSSVTDALELSLSKIGSGLKTAGPVALIAAIGKGIYDATMSAREFELTVERIGRKNQGGVANFSLADLQSNADYIREEIQKNKDSIKNPIAAVGSLVQDYAANAGNVLMGGESKTDEELQNARLERGIELQKNLEDALSRIAEKQRLIARIEKERLAGNKEGVEIASIEAAYAERIQKAISDKNPGLQDQLNREKEAELSAARRNQDVISARRLNERVGASMNSGDAERGVNMSAEDEQRQANLTRAGIAGMESEAASKAAKAAPEDKELAQQDSLAASNLKKVLAENAKWERDIARSKADQLKSVDAEIDAMRLVMQGRTFEAELLTKRVASEQAATKAVREGNDELAKRIRQSAQINQNQDRFNRALNQSTNRLRPASERAAESRRGRQSRRRKDRSTERFIKDAGLIRVERDSSGEVVGGYDPELNQRVENLSAKDLEERREGLRKQADSGGVPRSSREGEVRNTLEPAFKGATDFADALKPRGAAAMLNKTSMAPLIPSIATTEMDQKQAAAEASSQAQKDLSAAAKGASPDLQALTTQVNTISQILGKWAHADK